MKAAQPTYVTSNSLSTSLAAVNLEIDSIKSILG